MIGTWLARWNWLRWLRLGLGVVFVIEGWRGGGGMAYALGALLIAQGAFNMGCPMTASCAAPRSRQDQRSGEVSYEEIT